MWFSWLYSNWIVCVFFWTRSHWMMWIWELSLGIVFQCIGQVVSKHNLLKIPRSSSLKINLLAFPFLLKQNWFTPKFSFVVLMLGEKTVSLTAPVPLWPLEQPWSVFISAVLFLNYITFVTCPKSTLEVHEVQIPNKWLTVHLPR